jgi:hypothetical protein
MTRNLEGSEERGRGYYIRAKIGNNWMNVEVPFLETEDGRLYLSREDIDRIPELKDFIKRFHNFFTRVRGEDDYRWYFNPW